MMRYRALVLAVAVTGVTLALPPVFRADQAAGAAQGQSQGQPQAQQPPTFRTRIDSVSVDVTVTDRQGRPVTDLTAADFEVREGGKVQTIDTFKLISVDDADTTPVPTREILSLADQAREAADDRNRVFIILLDDYHVRQSNSFRVREQVADFVSRLGPRDLVAVLYPLTPIAATTFGRNHHGTAAAIRTFLGRKYDYTPRNAFEDRYQGQPPEIQERLRNDLTLSALEQACIFLGTLREGRKTLLFVSEGMSGTLPMGVNVKGTILQPGPTPSQSQSFFASTQLLSQLQQVFAAANRANTSIFTLDPRGLAVSEYDISDKVAYETDRAVLTESMDSLKVLADQTEGRAIVNRNDPMPELQRMMRELSSYYLLGYTSTVAPRDGKFHQIQVRVKRRDLDVKSRKGYWAYTAEEVERASATPKPGPPREVAAALDELAEVVEPGARRSLNLWVGARRGPGEKALVTFVWEAGGAPESPGDTIERVVVAAHSISGESLHNGPVARDATQPRPAGVVTFEAPAGALQVRATAENARGHRLDTEEATYNVPDFTSPGPTLSAPLVFRARTVREVQDLRAAASPTPTTTRQFSRSERLLLRFDAYGPAGSAPALAMRLLNRQGESLADLPAPKPARDATYDCDLPLGGLPPGDYLIEITATSGGDTAKKLLGIRITG